MKIRWLKRYSATSSTGGNLQPEGETLQVWNKKRRAWEDVPIETEVIIIDYETRSLDVIRKPKVVKISHEAKSQKA